jgi:hypothetical protein
LIAAATARQVRTQFAFEFFSEQIPGIAWRYTSPRALTLHGAAYAPLAISLQDHREGSHGKTSSTEFEIECAPVEPFLSYIGRGLPFVLAVRVHEVYIAADGSLWPDTFPGQMIDCKITPGKVNATFQRYALHLSRKFPRPLFQITDGRIPWARLEEWGLDPDAFGVTAQVHALDRNIVYCAAASAQPSDYYQNAFIEYTRPLGAVSVPIRWRVVTNVPSTDPSHPEQGYLVLSQPAWQLAEGDTFTLFPGVDGSRDQCLGIAENRFALNNFFSRILAPFQLIAAANNIAFSALQTGVPYQLPPLGSGGNSLARGFRHARLVDANGQPLDPQIATFDAAAGTITFTAQPGVSSHQADLRWLVPGTDAMIRGFQGFPEYPPQNPVITSQVSSGTIAGPAAQVVIGGYQNSRGNPIRTAIAGQTVTVVAALVEGVQSNFGSPSATDPIVVSDQHGHSVSVAPSSWGANATKIKFVLPSDVFTVGDPLTITLTNKGGEVGNNLDENDVPNNPPLSLVTAPHIDSVQDKLYNVITAAAITQTIRIVGNGFGGTKRSVAIGAVPVASISTWTDTEIVGAVPTASAYPYTGQVKVILPAGTILGENFTITGTIATGLIARFENSQGWRVTSGAAGLQIAIFGQNFGASRGAGTVRFNGVEVVAGGGRYVSWASNKIVVTLPAAPAYPATGPVHIHTNAGLDTDSAAAFTIGGPAGAVWLDSVQTPPVNGISAVITGARPGQLLYIIGANLGASVLNAFVQVSGSHPKWLSQPADQATTTLAFNNGQIKATVPSNASGATGQLTVHTGDVYGFAEVEGWPLPVYQKIADGVDSANTLPFTVIT